MNLSHSRARKFLSCPRSFQYLYVLGREGRDTAPELSYGNAWHALMEARWKGLPTPRVYDPAAKLGKHEEQVLLTSLAQYNELYPMTQDVIECEVEHDIELIPGHNLRCRFDALVRDNGRVYLVEHKTTSSDIGPGSYYWERLALDQQVSWYYLAAQSLGYDVAGVIYDVLRKPALRKGKNEAQFSFTSRCCEAITSEPSKYFARETVTRTKGDLEKAKENFAAIVDMINLGAYPQNPSSCFQFGRRCEYHEVCVGCANINDNSMFQDRTMG